MATEFRIEPGQYVKYRGSWGRVKLANHTHVFLEDWRGRLTTVAHLEEIEEVKSDERLAEDPYLRVYRRFDDFGR